MKYQTNFTIGKHQISTNAPTYFIADIAANHDADLSRAKELIWKAAEAGADVAKFQHFLAEKIVSDIGFKALGDQIAHQANWGKSVYEIYEQYQVDREWNDILAAECIKANIDFMTTPYDLNATTGVDTLVEAYKIGSGDITWTNFLADIAKLKKPIFLSTGASSQADVSRAVEQILNKNNCLCLLQCNTNYTNDLSNYKYINLNVLRTFAEIYPGMPLGLSDHTQGCSTVLGAVALGACVIEKHFTDDNARTGPDHGFSMNPVSWREMVDRTRELEAAMGNGIKKIEENERDAAIVQRRCVRLTRNVHAGETLSEDDIECLRPAPNGALAPYEINDWLGAKYNCDKKKGDALFVNDMKEPS
jgi:sialic acid synthase SpsE